MAIETHPNSWPIKQYERMVQNDTIRFEYPIQRGGDQWNENQKSLLIDSIVNGFPIPPLYFLSRKEIVAEGKKPVAIREVLDGKQRLTTIIKYISNEFRLVKTLKTVELNGVDYEIAGKTFEELDEEIKDAILSKNLSCYTMDQEYTTDEEIEELFFRMNNATALTPQQKVKSIVGISFSRLLNDVKSHELFNTVSGFTSGQLRKDEHQGAILQTMFHLEEFAYKKMTPAVLNEYALGFKNDFDNKVIVLGKVESALDYLAEAFEVNGTEPLKQPFLLKKINFPMTVSLAVYAVENEIDSQIFSMWAVAFMDAIKGLETNNKTNYLDYTGGGSTDASKVEGRLNEMKRHFIDYVELFNK